MAKTLIIYFSKYGTTKKYSEWIAEELAGDICSVNDFRQNILNNYDTIILGNSLYAGKIEGLNIFMKNYETLKNKKLILFTCGLADYSKEENINSIYRRIKNELPEEIIEKIKIFYLRGGINYKMLTLKHKIMMWMVKKIRLRNDTGKLSDETKEFIETYGKKVDFMNKENINKIIEYNKIENE
jgi:menaquinone-dependent protoporphyrinogen IX oxidase